MTVVNSPLVGVQLHGESRRLRRLGALARLQRLHQALRRQQRVHLNRASIMAGILPASLCMHVQHAKNPSRAPTHGRDAP